MRQPQMQTSGRVLPVMSCPRPGIGADFGSLVRGRDVLIIGSGNDLDGRGMGEEIDNGDRVVIRVNKAYGAPEDVGKRTDVIFIRFKHWLELYPWFSREAQENALCIVVCNEEIGYSKADMTRAKAACSPKPGTQVGSCGFLAVEHALHCGARSVDLIGFGWRNGKFSTFKEYTKAKVACVPVTCRKDNIDRNQALDWDAEHKFYLDNSRVRLVD